MSHEPATLRRTMRANLRAVLPEIAARAWRAEAERKVPAENVEQLKHIGFTRAFLPRRYGGLGRHHLGAGGERPRLGVGR